MHIISGVIVGHMLRKLVAAFAPLVDSDAITVEGHYPCTFMWCL
jgi:hypothetical protein